MKRINYLVLIFLLLATVNVQANGFFESLFSSFSTVSQVSVSANSAQWLSQAIRNINLQAPNLDANVLRLSLLAYSKARKLGLDHKGLLTIIDYSKPSTERRLWVVNVNSGKVLFNTWVSHGKNSGTITATSFSNVPGSLKSSIGVFLTEDSYQGGNGLSLRLMGLEHGFNDNALRRDIVVHGAWYVNADVIHKYGQIGRSWGCPAVSPNLIGPIVNTIKNRTLVVAYYPDRRWLHNSTFLAG